MSACACGCGVAVPSKLPGTPGPSRTYATTRCRDRLAGSRYRGEPAAKAARQRYNAKPENKEKQRLAAQKYRLREKYGMTIEDYEALLATQAGGCAICGTGETLSVDHDHDTGRVRGILCRDRNLAEGFANGDPERLRALANYLESITP